MSKSFDAIMLFIDIYLFVYFINLSMDATDIYIRLFGCLLTTSSVFFLKKDISNIFSKNNSN